jgi:hypothetical protein
LPKYTFAKPGENKFLESIYIWLDVDAPRFWWQEFDTYRIGISKQSASTMHTICKKELMQDSFEDPIFDESLYQLNLAIYYWKNETNIEKKKELFSIIKNNLPEGFLQRRIVCMNYKCLQNIYIQRKDHRLPQWRFFLSNVLRHIEHPEFIEKEINNE